MDDLKVIKALIQLQNVMDLLKDNSKYEEYASELSKISTKLYYELNYADQLAFTKWLEKRYGSKGE